MMIKPFAAFQTLGHLGHGVEIHGVGEDDSQQSAQHHPHAVMCNGGSQKQQID
jgi:hypothetical protein